MDNGTFEQLSRNPQITLQNTTGFDGVKGIIVGGNLSIICENPASTDLISWVVLAERKDRSMMESPLTDEEGYLVTQRE
jgi:hypothetical protein